MDNIFKPWYAEMPNEDLVKMIYSLSEKITTLRDTPFCTIRQFEDLQEEINAERTLLRIAWEELETRDVPVDEKEQIMATVLK